MRWSLLVVGTVVAALACPALARADGGDVRRETKPEPDLETKEEAAAAYDRGAAAYDEGDFARAARELARADDLAPNEVTLALALDAAVRTEDAVLGMTLAERADARTMTKALDQASHLARRRFASRVGRVSVVCPPPSSCTATLDGTPFAHGKIQFVVVGPHAMRVVRDSAVETFAIVVEAGKSVELVPTARRERPEPTSKDAAPAGGLSPAWFFGGVGLTAALSAASIASGLDTLRAHRAYVADKSDARVADAGYDAMVRTNVLLVASGALALTTAAVGVFAVRWSGGRTSMSAAGQTVIVRHAF